jgi:hypothetical protein
VDVEVDVNARLTNDRIDVIGNPDDAIEGIVVDGEKVIGWEDLGAVFDVIVFESAGESSDGDINIAFPERTRTAGHDNGVKTFEKENDLSGFKEKKGKGNADFAHQKNEVYDRFLRGDDRKLIGMEGKGKRRVVREMKR